jgi:hypothetical protein
MPMPFLSPKNGSRALSHMAGFCWLVLASAFRLSAAETVDDFNSGAAPGWRLPAGFAVVEKAPGDSVLRGDVSSDSFAQRTGVLLGRISWRVEADIRFRRYGADGGNRALTAISLFPGVGDGVQLLATVQHLTNNSVSIDVAWFDSGAGLWRGVLQQSWTASRSSEYRLQLTRRDGANTLLFKVTSASGFVYRGETAPMSEAFLDRMVIAGFRLDHSSVDFDNFRTEIPYEPASPPVITQPPTNQLVISGSSVTFRVAASSPRPLTYQWYRGTSPLTGATNDTYSLPVVTTASNNSFSVLVDDGRDFVFSRPATLTVINASIRPAIPFNNPDGFALDLNVTPNRAFALQSSTNLLDWVTETNMIGGGAVRVLPAISEPSTGPTNRFFRLLIP